MMDILVNDPMKLSELGKIAHKTFINLSILLIIIVKY